MSSNESVLRNPVLLLTWGIPLLAVIASFATLALALLKPDGELPEQYHWEGTRIDRDFDRAARAAQLHVRAALQGFAATGMCAVALTTAGPAPQTLTLRLTHATEPALDRQFELHRRVEAPPVYISPCKPVPDGHWRLELIDNANGWSLRQTVTTALNGAVVDSGANAQD